MPLMRYMAHFFVPIPLNKLKPSIYFFPKNIHDTFTLIAFTGFYNYQYFLLMYLFSIIVYFLLKNSLNLHLRPASKHDSTFSRRTRKFSISRIKSTWSSCSCAARSKIWSKSTVNDETTTSVRCGMTKSAQTRPLGLFKQISGYF